MVNINYEQTILSRLKQHLNDMSKKKISLYQFLQFVDFDEIVQEIRGYYQREPKFPVKGMLLLSLGITIMRKVI